MLGALSDRVKTQSDWVTVLRRQISLTFDSGSARELQLSLPLSPSLSSSVRHCVNTTTRKHAKLHIGCKFRDPEESDVSLWWSLFLSVLREVLVFDGLLPYCPAKLPSHSSPPSFARRCSVLHSRWWTSLPTDFYQSLRRQCPQALFAINSTLLHCFLDDLCLDIPFQPPTSELVASPRTAL